MTDAEKQTLAEITDYIEAQNEVHNAICDYIQANRASVLDTTTLPEVSAEDACTMLHRLHWMVRSVQRHLECMVQDLERATRAKRNKTPDKVKEAFADFVTHSPNEELLPVLDLLMAMETQKTPDPNNQWSLNYHNEMIEGWKQMRPYLEWVREMHPAYMAYIRSVWEKHQSSALPLHSSVSWLGGETE